MSTREQLQALEHLPRTSVLDLVEACERMLAHTTPEEYDDAAEQMATTVAYAREWQRLEYERAQERAELVRKAAVA